VHVPFSHGGGGAAGNQNQRQLFHSFCLDDVVPDDQREREIAGVLDSSRGGGRVLRRRYKRLSTCDRRSIFSLDIFRSPARSMKKPPPMNLNENKSPVKLLLLL
jgi:hypothetical protein